LGVNWYQLVLTAPPECWQSGAVGQIDLFLTPTQLIPSNTLPKSMEGKNPHPCFTGPYQLSIPYRGML
jgi:hypothetical protein